MSGIRLPLGGLAAVLFLFASPQLLSGQASVVLVDINQVFDRHPAFNAELERLKADAQTLQATVQQKRQQLQAQAEQLGLVYTQGSAEYSKREKEIALEGARIDLEARDQMRELTRREARLHYDVYRQISDQIAAWCRETGTQLVIRFSATPVQESDPNSIMHAVNAAVVWHRPDRDATRAIVERISQLPTGTGQPATTSR